MVSIPIIHKPRRGDTKPSIRRNVILKAIENIRRTRVPTKTLDQHIEITPGVVGGKPRIAGHRISVHDIAIWHERLGRSADEIATEYDLTLAGVYAALAYYFHHREEIDQQIKQGQALAEDSRQRSPSKVSQKFPQ